MAQISIGLHEKDVITKVANELNLPVEKVIRQMVGGKKMTTDDSALAELLKSRPRKDKDMFDKMMEMQMIEKMGGMGGKKKEESTMDFKEAMMFSLMSRMMPGNPAPAPAQQTDPMMMMMMTMMKGDKSGDSMDKVYSLFEKMATQNKPDDGMKDIVKDLIEKRNKDDIGSEIEALRAQQMADRQEMMEMLRTVWERGSPQQSDSRGYDYSDENSFDNIPLGKAHELVGRLDAAGLTQPKSEQDHRRTLEAEAQRSKFDSEKEMTTKGFSILDKGFQSVDRKLETIGDAVLQELKEERRSRREDAAPTQQPQQQSPYSPESQQAALNYWQNYYAQMQAAPPGQYPQGPVQPEDQGEEPLTDPNQEDVEHNPPPTSHAKKSQISQNTDGGYQCYTCGSLCSNENYCNICDR